MLFYAEMPDPSLHNSSPYFKSHPLPFICMQQFFRFGFQAIDDDGDSLVYVLSTPMDGGHTSQSNPNPFSILGSGVNPSAPPSAPYSNASWTSGYSLANICGSSSPLTLNSATGEIEVIPPFQGIYAMAVEVREYRNGIYIGLVRREIEFTVIACTGNSAPSIPPSISISNQIQVFAGDTVQFIAKAKDAEGDSVYINHFGGIFQDSPIPVIDPPYAVSNNVNGDDSAQTSFIWTTGCQHIASVPYLISYEAYDNGCPLVLTSIEKIKIKVAAPPQVAKSNLLCIQLLDSNTLRITRVSDTAVSPRYFSYFRLYRSINGSAFIPYKLITSVNPVEIFDSAAFNNKVNDYCYVLSSFNSCNMEGDRSDTLCSVSHINRNKNYLESVSVNSENTIELKWEPFSTGSYSLYYIYKKYNDSSAFKEVAVLDNYNKFTWDDIDVFTGKYSYCYEMMNQDVCGNKSDTSIIACSILLNGETKPFLNSLRWSDYINWKGGLSHYDIMRKPDNTSDNYFVAGSTLSDLFYYDRDMPLNNGIYNYYIKAYEGVGGRNATSNSNEIVLTQAPFEYIPNAFTPNNDGRNDLFFDQGSFILDFNINIYNRWGQQVFSSNEQNKHWDGTFNGKPSPAGVYLYKLKYKGYNNSIKEKTGNITLIR